MAQKSPYRHTKLPSEELRKQGKSPFEEDRREGIQRRRRQQRWVSKTTIKQKKRRSTEEGQETSTSQPHLPTRNRKMWSLREVSCFEEDKELSHQALFLKSTNEPTTRRPPELIALLSQHQQTEPLELQLKTIFITPANSSCRTGNRIPSRAPKLA